jgi:hypothetical protein
MLSKYVDHETRNVFSTRVIRLMSTLMDQD